MAQFLELATLCYRVDPIREVSEGLGGGRWGIDEAGVGTVFSVPESDEREVVVAHDKERFCFFH
jgi:hypothetical protein